jgi:hypothetical protein
MSTRWVAVCYQVHFDLGWSLVVTDLDSGIGLPALLTGGTWQASMGGAFTAISKSEASLLRLLYNHQVGAISCVWGWILGLHNGGVEFEVIIFSDAVQTWVVATVHVSGLGPALSGVFSPDSTS